MLPKYGTTCKVHTYSCLESADTALKVQSFIEARRFPDPWRPQLKGSNLSLEQINISSISVEASQGSGTFSLLLNTEFLGQYPCTFQTTACMHLKSVIYFGVLRFTVPAARLVKNHFTNGKMNSQPFINSAHVNHFRN